MKRQSQCGGSQTYFLYVLYNWRTVFVPFVQLEKGSTGSPPSQSYTDRWANIQLHLIFLFWSGQSRNHSWGMCVLLLRIYGLGYHKPLLYVAHCTHDCQIFVLASVTVWIGDQSLCSCLICFKELTKAGGHLWWSAFSNRFIPHVRTSTVYHHIMNSKHGSPELVFVKKHCVIELPSKCSAWSQKISYASLSPLPILTPVFTFLPSFSSPELCTQSIKFIHEQLPLWLKPHSW